MNRVRMRFTVPRLIRPTSPPAGGHDEQLAATVRQASVPEMNTDVGGTRGFGQVETASNGDHEPARRHAVVLSRWSSGGDPGTKTFHTPRRKDSRP